MDGPKTTYVLITLPLIQSLDTCGHGRKYETDCEIDLNALTSFKTGRKDCTPDSSLTRPFYTTKDEIHPNLHGNGPATVGYFKQHFGITAREAAALVEGAHSFGKVLLFHLLTFYASIVKSCISFRCENHFQSD